MKYSPLKNNNKATAMAAICAVFAVVLFVASAFVFKFVILYQVSAIVLAIISLQVYLKYIASDYVYEADDEDLRIYKVNGKKSICVANLSYAASKSKIFTLSEYKTKKQDLPKYAYTVNYAKNLYPQDYCLYMFDFNGKTVRMKFEPDDVFVAYFNNKIEILLSDNK